MIFVLTLGDVLLTPANNLELAHVPNPEECRVGSLSWHAGRVNCYKLSVTAQLLSRFFFNPRFSPDLWRPSAFSIQPEELYTQVVYLRSAPGFLTDDFDA
jgi:hypothetical protein